MTSTIGIVAALSREARAMAGLPLRQKAGGYPFCRVMLKDDTALMVVQSGMGAENAFGAAKRLAEKRVAALGCFGVSGGLDPQLKTGDVVFAEAVFKQAGDAVFPVWEKGGAHFDESIKCAAAEGFTVRPGPIITVAAPVLNARDKRALFHQTNALAVDMESAAVAHAADDKGLPFFAFRTICDPADVSLPKALYQCVDQKGTPRIFHSLRLILQKPSLLSCMLRMKRDFDAALAVGPCLRRCFSEMRIPIVNT